MGNDTRKDTNKGSALIRGWKGDKMCSFCTEDESLHHLFFKYDVAIWLAGGGADWVLCKCAKVPENSAAFHKCSVKQQMPANNGILQFP